MVSFAAHRTPYHRGLRLLSNLLCVSDGRVMEEGVDNGDWLGDAVKGRTWGMRLKVSEVVVDG